MFKTTLRKSNFSRWILSYWVGKSGYGRWAYIKFETWNEAINYAIQKRLL